MKIGSKGKAVKKVQRKLIDKGYVLPRFGPDGDLGSETWITLHNYAVQHSIPWDDDAFESEQGPVPAAVIEHVLRDEPVRARRTDSDKKDKHFYDITGDHALIKGRSGPRNPATIDTIVLHQTAVTFGTTKGQRKRFGSEEAARRARFHNVACHVAALTSGEVLYVNRLPAYVYHANVANRFSIGIEVEGLYAGVSGRDNTVWGKNKPTKLTDTTIDAGRRAVRFAYDEGIRLGMPLQWIMPHRCYSNSRMSDPGEQLWREIALWAMADLGLKARYDVALNGGRHIPYEWDPNGAYDYRGRPR
jgi:hypothetical protein